ncbi:SPOR domain-containing protein [Allohahella marinimesophila]
MLYAALAAGFIWFLVTLNAVPVEKAVESLKKGQTAEEDLPADKKRSYDFYKMLPEAKVIPQHVPEYVPKAPDPSVVYILQTGSFRSHADAEKQKATIAFQGMQAHIEQTNTADNGIWYRVIVGPFQSRSKMNRAIDSLVRVRIQPLVRKKKIETTQ